MPTAELWVLSHVVDTALRWPRGRTATLVRLGLVPGVLLRPKLARIRKTDFDAFLLNPAAVAQGSQLARSRTRKGKETPGSEHNS